MLSKTLSRRKILFLGLIIFSTSVFSADVDCSTKSNTLEIVACHDARYIVADKKLNKIYSLGTKNLDENQKKALRQSQLSWLKYRDNTFSLAIEKNRDSGSFSNVLISNFKATFVEQRVSELKELFMGPGDGPDWLD